MFNPVVLVAILNIYRVWFNWFEPRQYVSGSGNTKDTEEVSAGFSSVKVPSTDEVVRVEKRRKAAPILSTPAVRLGLYQDKGPYLAEFEDGVWVEDKLKNALSGVNAGHEAFLIRTGRNKKDEGTHERSGHVNWVNNWQEIMAHL